MEQDPELWQGPGRPGPVDPARVAHGVPINGPPAVLKADVEAAGVHSGKHSAASTFWTRRTIAITTAAAVLLLILALGLGLGLGLKHHTGSDGDSGGNIGNTTVDNHGTTIPATAPASEPSETLIAPPNPLAHAPAHAPTIAPMGAPAANTVAPTGAPAAPIIAPTDAPAAASPVATSCAGPGTIGECHREDNAVPTCGHSFCGTSECDFSCLPCNETTFGQCACDFKPEYYDTCGAAGFCMNYETCVPTCGGSNC